MRLSSLFLPELRRVLGGHRESLKVQLRNSREHGQNAFATAAFLLRRVNSLASSALSLAASAFCLSFWVLRSLKLFFRRSEAASVE